MLVKLLLLFTIVPLVELALLIYLSTLITFWPTIGLVVATALLGAVLGKIQGLKAWRGIQEDLNHGKIPAASLVNGLAVLIAGIFLITPGVLTDLVAILLLIPVTRRPLANWARHRLEKMVAEGTVQYLNGQVQQGPFGPGFGPGFGPEFDRGFRPDDDIIDVTARQPSGPDDNEGSTESPSDASLPRTW